MLVEPTFATVTQWALAEFKPAATVNTCGAVSDDQTPGPRTTLPVAKAWSMSVTRTLGLDEATGDAGGDARPMQTAAATTSVGTPMSQLRVEIMTVPFSLDESPTTLNA